MDLVAPKIDRRFPVFRGDAYRLGGRVACRTAGTVQLAVHPAPLTGPPRADRGRAFLGRRALGGWVELDHRIVSGRISRGVGILFALIAALRMILRFVVRMLRQSLCGTGSCAFGTRWPHVLESNRFRRVVSSGSAGIGCFLVILWISGCCSKAPRLRDQA